MSQKISAQKKVLLVEDELAIREMMKFAFYNSPFDLIEAEDAEQAQRIILQDYPDLILLDWMLPGMSGIELAKRLRKDDFSKEIPIIMLTARGDEYDRIRGLDAGADDYVTKPFSPKELMARIKAVLRRSSPEKEGLIELGGITIDTHKHRLLVNNTPFELGPTEYNLLHFFMTHAERVYNRTQLLDRVWGSDIYIEERTIDVHIRRLRKALADHGVDQYIQTVRGAGYRFSLK